MAEEKILRVGEWFADNKWGYSTPVEYMIPVAVSQGGTTSQITFEKRTISLITPDNLEAIFRAYDKYLDDRLVL
jgi:hypothetical protein